MKKLVLFVASLLVLFASLPAAANEDAEGCTDAPLFSRMNNFYIDGCERNFDSIEIYTAEDVTTTIEGEKTVLNYWIKTDEESGEALNPPSPLQIRRNFENALKSISGETLFSDEDYLSGRVVISGIETWISLSIGNGGETYTLTILRAEEMTQEVTANQMLEALNKAGFISLYINFETGKSVIKPESQNMIDTIMALLQDNPDLKISVEGHTDNVGTPESNMKLSQLRAQAVQDALRKQGIDAARISSVGWGLERPIADNRSEEGRAKNRRVEIVKQ